MLKEKSEKTLYTIPTSELNTIMKDDPFWYNELNILYNKYRLIEFIPQKSYSFSENLNALVRFSFYFSVILFITTRNYLVFYILIITMLITLLIYSNWNGSTKLSNKEEFKTLQEQIKINENIQISEDGNVCALPTKDNPFMNVLLTDYVDNPNKPPNCDLTPTINNEIESNFSYNLYQNVDSIWGKNNSQRQYYTTPNTTIPNDRESFQNWLYKTGPTCKEDSLMCNEYLSLQDGIPNSGNESLLKISNKQISPHCNKDCVPNSNIYRPVA